MPQLNDFEIGSSFEQFGAFSQDALDNKALLANGARLQCQCSLRSHPVPAKSSHGAPHRLSA
jgi:hypothetical protein